MLNISFPYFGDLDLSRGNMEPLGDRGINRFRRARRSGRKVGIHSITLRGKAWRVREGYVTDRKIVARGISRSFARDQTTPCFMAFMDDLHGIFLVFGLTRKGKSILRLAIRDFVDPVTSSTNE